MRLCPDCSNWKPDACFTKAPQGRPHLEDTRWFDECGQCRTDDNRATTYPKVPGVAKIKTPRGVAKIKKTFQQELKAFRRRGAPVIARVYVKTPRGIVVGKSGRKIRAF